MFTRRSLWITTPLMLALVAGLARPNAAAEDPPPANDNAAAPAENPQRTRMVNRINRRLAQLKPTGSSKKDEEDFFVVGTAVLVRQTGHADVCFQVHQGQRTTAEFLFDFMVQATPANPRDWHVFYRLKDSDQADQALAQTRMQYDQLASYREQLKQQYQATSIRRC